MLVVAQCASAGTVCLSAVQIALLLFISNGMECWAVAVAVCSAVVNNGLLEVFIWGHYGPPSTGRIQFCLPTTHTAGAALLLIAPLRMLIQLPIQNAAQTQTMFYFYYNCFNWKWIPLWTQWLIHALCHPKQPSLSGSAHTFNWNQLVDLDFGQINTHTMPMQDYASPKQYVQFVQVLADVCIYQWPNGVRFST